MRRSLAHRCARLALTLIAIVWAMSPRAVLAQGGISVTFPSRLAAGPDYATDAFGDPWDFCNAEDIGPNPDTRVGFSTFGFLPSPCRLTMTTSSDDASFAILDRGLYGVAINPGRNGRNFPIDTSRYRVISYKVTSTTTEHPQVYWFQNPAGFPGGDGLGGRLMPQLFPGTHILIANLTQATEPGLQGWSGLVRGLRLDPNWSAGGTQTFHWVRLTTPPGQSGTPGTQNISWTGGSGNATISVRDNSDGTTLTIATGVSGTSFLWHYGVLPPGSYTLTVTRQGGGSGTANFTINNPPRIEITNPSMTSGEDYATRVLGNAWDMSQSSDIQLVGSAHLTNLSFSGGQLHATNTTNDPIIGLLASSNNGVPIDTSRYRYLTYRFQVDGAYDLGEGSVARVFWGSASQLTDSTITTSYPIIVWPGMNSYTIDLATLTPALDGGIEAFGAAEPWTAANKRFFRFDPHEFPQPRPFHIDEIKLTAKPVAGGPFTITFKGSDPDGDAATVSLFYDTDRNPSNGRSLIVSGLPQSAGQYTWNPGGVPVGEYYIYAESSDGVQAVGRYSSAPVVVVATTPPHTPTGLRVVH